MAFSLFLSTADRRDHRDDRAEYLAKPVQSDRADFNRLSAGEAWSGVVEYGEPRLARLISAVLLGQERVHAGLQPSQAGIGVAREARLRKVQRPIDVQRTVSEFWLIPENRFCEHRYCVQITVPSD
jgi:hypothetical protein